MLKPPDSKKTREGSPHPKEKCSMRSFEQISVECYCKLQRLCTRRTLGTCTNYQFRKFQTARSRLYQSRFLRPNTHFSAFFELYKIHKPSHRSTLKIFRFFANFRKFSLNFRDFAKFAKICVFSSVFSRNFLGISRKS